MPPGHAAVTAGHRVRYSTAAVLVETLYQRLANNSIGQVIDRLLGWLHRYDHHRGHTALGGLPPVSRVPNLMGQNA